MANIRNAEEALLLGSAQVEEWRGQFLEEWYMPMKSMLLNVMMQSLGPERRRVLKDLSGDAYDNVAAKFDLKEG